jgi:hypothetical protein
MKNNMKRLMNVLLLACFALGFSCSRGQEGKQVEEDHDFPEWLSTQIREIETLNARDVSIVKIRIYACQWQNQEVYYIYNSFSSCVLCEVYYKNGEKIVFTAEDVTDFFTISKNWKLIYEFGQGLF